MTLLSAQQNEKDGLPGNLFNTQARLSRADGRKVEKLVRRY